MGLLCVKLVAAYQPAVAALGRKLCTVQQHALCIGTRVFSCADSSSISQAAVQACSLPKRDPLLAGGRRSPLTARLTSRSCPAAGHALPHPARACRPGSPVSSPCSSQLA